MPRVLVVGAGGLSSHIHHVKWDKLAWNAAFNAISTLTRRTVGEILDGRPGEALIRDTMAEVAAVARALGIELRGLETSITRSRTQLPDFRTSMLQDLERGKRLEHDALNGAVVRAGARAGVPTPLNATFDRLLAAIDPGLRSRP